MYLQRLLLAIWFFGLLGVSAELVLLEHYEDQLQLIPLAVLGLGLAVSAWYAASPREGSRRWFQGILALFALSGILGVILHYRGNAEFEVERDPTIGGVRLVWESLTGATPALSPGTMILFAFIGYAVLIARRSSPG